MFHVSRWASSATLCAVVLVGASSEGRALGADSITVRGMLVSESVAVPCPLPPQVAAATAVLEAAAEGSQVRKGDVLVRFDSTPLEAGRMEQELAVRAADAELTAAESQVEAAQLSLEEYLQGTYVEQKESARSAVLLAEGALNLARRSLDSARKRAGGAKTSDDEPAEKEFAVRRAEEELRLAKLRGDLLDRYSKPRMTRQIQGAIRSAQAARGLAQAKRAAAESRVRDLSQAIQRCVVRAPAEGQVHYPPQASGRSGDASRVGGRVVPRRALAYLVHGLRFQATLAQADAARIRQGTAATIQVDAYPDKTFNGRVQKVQPISGSDAGEMTVLIELADPPGALRSGMTGQAVLALSHTQAAQGGAKK